MSLNQVFTERNQTDAASRITRRLRRNVFGTYNGVGLVPRIRITPNQNERRTRVLDAGKRWGGRRIDLIRMEGLDGMIEEIWLVRVTNHEEYSNRTFSAKANNLAELYRKLGKMRNDWIREVEEQSEVYDIIRRPIGVETAIVQRLNERGNILNAPMLAAGTMEIDGYVRNKEWCSNTGRCCPDYLMYLYKDTKGMKKKLTYEAIEKAAGTYPWANPNTNGYSISHMARIAREWNVSIYAIEDERIIFSQSAERRREKAMVFCIRNQHLYPIFDTKQVKHWTEKAKKIGSSLHKPKNKEEREEIIREPYLRISNEWNHPDVIQRIMEDCLKNNEQNKTGVTMVGNRVIDYKNNGKNFHFDSLHVNGVPPLLYLTQSDQWKNVPQSFVSPEVRAALGSPNVKYRTHYGGEKDICHNIRIGDPWDDKKENVKCFDINKHYRSVMENPLDDWMSISFGATVEECESFEPPPKAGHGDAEHHHERFGLYFVETDDLDLLHGSNWYSNTILQLARAYGIKFNVKYFIKGERCGKTCFTELITFLQEDVTFEKITDFQSEGEPSQDEKDSQVTKLVKYLINMLSGLCGKTQTNRTQFAMTTDTKRMLHKAVAMKNPQLRKHEGLYLIGDKTKIRNVTTRLPIYLQILDFANMVLHKHIIETGGTLVWRKTDAFALLYPKNVNVSDDIGGYKFEPKEFDFSTIRIERPAQERAVSYKKPSYKMNLNKHIKDSDQYREILETFVRLGGLTLLGRGGVGKSYAAKMILKILTEEKGKRVCVMGFTNKCMIQWLPYGGKTIHKTFGVDLKTGQYDPAVIRRIMNNYDVVLIEEISMIPLDLWKIIYELKLSTGKQFILVGDGGQLPPVDNSDFDIFKSPLLGYLTEYNCVELSVRKRYDLDLWNFSESFRDAPPMVGDGRNVVPLHYGKKSNLKPPHDAKATSEGMKLCYFNRTRKYINKQCNKDVVGLFIPVKKGDSEQAQDATLAKGVPVISNVSNSDLGVAKNEMMEICEIDNNTVSFLRERDGVTDIITDDIENFHKRYLLGYCVTIHKSQGDTIHGRVNIYDWNHVKKYNRVAYTAVTRATAFANIHVGNIYIPDEEKQI